MFHLVFYWDYCSSECLSETIVSMSLPLRAVPISLQWRELFHWDLHWESCSNESFTERVVPLSLQRRELFHWFFHKVVLQLSMVAGTSVTDRCNLAGASSNGKQVVLYSTKLQRGLNFNNFLHIRIYWNNFYIQNVRSSVKNMSGVGSALFCLIHTDPTFL